MIDLTPSQTVAAEVRCGDNAFAYVACDIEPELTIAEYRRRRAAKCRRSRRVGLAALLARVTPTAPRARDQVFVTP